MHCEQTSDNGPLLCFFSLRHQPWLWPGPDGTRGAVIQGLASTLPWKSLSPPPKILKHPMFPFWLPPSFCWNSCSSSFLRPGCLEVHRLTAYRFAKPLVCPSEIKSLAGNRSCDWKACLPLFWIYHFLVCWFSGAAGEKPHPFLTIDLCCEFIPRLHRIISLFWMFWWFKLSTWVSSIFILLAGALWDLPSWWSWLQTLKMFPVLVYW